MSVWAAKDMIFRITRSDNGKFDTVKRTVKIVSVKDGSEITCTQLDSLYSYKPDSNGETDDAYDKYADGVKIGRMYGPDLMMPIGG
mgnify:CR=1 FL=1